MKLPFSVSIELLLPALVLLWLPRAWLRRGPAFFRRRKHRGEPWNRPDAGDPRVNFRTEFGKFRNYVELLRALVGTWLIAGGAGLPAALTAESGGPSGRAVLVAQSVILLIGVVVQTLRWEHRHVALFPAIFYLAGMTIGWGDWRGGLFAFVLVWAINPALPNARGFLLLHALLLAGFGWFFPGRGLAAVGVGAFLVFLPVLLSLLAGRPLVLLTRKSSRGGVQP